MRIWTLGLLLVVACRSPTEPEPVIPEPAASAVILHVACPSVWSIDVDGVTIGMDSAGALVPVSGGLWFFPVATDYPLRLSTGRHAILLHRWHPTIGAGVRDSVTVGDTLALSC